jgi:hypothetical protein
LQLYPRFFFIVEGSFQKKYCQACWEKLINNMFYQPWHNVILQLIFGLWLSKEFHDVFALIINLLRVKWKPKHITIGLFETT